MRIRGHFVICSRFLSITLDIAFICMILVPGVFKKKKKKARKSTEHRSQASIQRWPHY